MEPSHLEWDSRLFGFPVWKISPGALDENSLRKTLGELRAKGAALIYWASDPGDPESQKAAQALGGFLADRKVTYCKDLPERPSRKESPADFGVENYGKKDPDQDLYQLALLSGTHSRFKIDPKIPAGKFEALYRAWVENSTQGEMAQALLVRREGNRVLGMVTLGLQEGVGVIGLVAVDPGSGGKGLGKSLIRAAQAWFVEKGCRKARVVTQGENLPACRLYEKCGFSVEKTENFYHFWLR